MPFYYVFLYLYYENVCNNSKGILKLYKVYIDNTSIVTKNVTVDVDGITSIESVGLEVDDPIVVGYYAVESEAILQQDILKGYTDFKYEELPIAYGDISQVANAVNTINGNEMITELKNNLDTRTFQNVANFVLGKPLIDKPIIIDNNRGEGTNGVYDTGTDSAILTVESGNTGTGTGKKIRVIWKKDLRGEGTNGVYDINDTGDDSTILTVEGGTGTGKKIKVIWKKDLRGEGTNGVYDVNDTGTISTSRLTVEGGSTGTGTGKKVKIIWKKDFRTGASNGVFEVIEDDAPRVIDMRGEGTNGIILFRGEGTNGVMEMRGDGNNDIIEFDGFNVDNYTILEGENGYAIFDLRGEGTNGLMYFRGEGTNGVFDIQGTGGKMVFSVRGEGTNGVVLLRGEGTNGLVDIRGEGTNGFYDTQGTGGVVLPRGEGTNGRGEGTNGVVLYRGEGTNGIATQYDVTNALKEYFDGQLNNQTTPIILTDADTINNANVIQQSSQVTTEQIQEVQQRIDKKIQDQIQFVKVRDALLPILEVELQRTLNGQIEQQKVVQEPIQSKLPEPTQQDIPNKEVISVIDSGEITDIVLEEKILQEGRLISDIIKQPAPEPKYAYKEITEEELQSSFVYQSTQIQSEREVKEMFTKEQPAQTTLVAVQVESEVIPTTLRGEGTNGIIEPTQKSIVNNFGDSIMGTIR